MIHLFFDEVPLVTTQGWTITGDSPSGSDCSNFMARMSKTHSNNHETVDDSEEQVSEMMTSVFPNPVKTFITIRSGVEQLIQVRSVNGSNTAQIEVKRGDNQLDLSGWPSGVYFFYTGYGREVKKVLKE